MLKVMVCTIGLILIVFKTCFVFKNKFYITHILCKHQFIIIQFVTFLKKKFVFFCYIAHPVVSIATLMFLFWVNTIHLLQWGDKKNYCIQFSTDAQCTLSVGQSAYYEIKNYEHLFHKLLILLIEYSKIIIVFGNNDG